MASEEEYTGCGGGPAREWSGENVDVAKRPGSIEADVGQSGAFKRRRVLGSEENGSVWLVCAERGSRPPTTTSWCSG
jgi:hypothetical protein